MKLWFNLLNANINKIAGVIIGNKFCKLIKLIKYADKLWDISEELNPSNSHKVGGVSMTHILFDA